MYEIMNYLRFKGRNSCSGSYDLGVYSKNWGSPLVL